MKRFVTLVFAVLIALTLVGCRSGWKLRVVDSDDRPVPNAGVHVWVYGLDPERPQEHAAELGERYEGGEKLFGWHFQTNDEGKALCKGLRTGRRVRERVPQATVTRVPNPPERKEVYSVGSELVVVYPSGYKVVTRLPRKDERDRPFEPEYRYRYKPATWLGVTVIAQGYRPHHFAFKPDSRKGNMGTIVLEREPCGDSVETGPGDSDCRVHVSEERLVPQTSE